MLEELEKLLDEKKYKEAKLQLNKLNISDVAELLEDIETKEVSNIYALLLTILTLIKGLNITFNMTITMIFLIAIKNVFDKYIGYGDIKLMISLVLFGGEEYVLYSFAVSAIVAYIYMKTKKKNRISFLPIFNVVYMIFLLIYK